MHKATIAERSGDTNFLVQRLSKAEVGDVITYEEMSSLIGRDIRNGARGNLESAKRIVLSEKQFVFETIRGTGIKRLSDNEIPTVGHQAIRKIHRTARRGIKKLSAVDYKQLNNDSRTEHNMLISALGAVSGATKETTLKQVRDVCAQQQEKIPYNKTLEQFKRK